MNISEFFSETLLNYIHSIRDIRKELPKDALTRSYDDSLLLYLLEKKKRIECVNNKDFLFVHRYIHNTFYEYSIGDKEDRTMDWFSMIFEFAKFIKLAEKCFMYINDESAPICVKVMDDKLVIYFKFERYKAKISYEKTKIPSNPNQSDSVLFSGNEDIMNTNPNISKNLFFIDITIAREYGKKMANVFKFMSNETPKINDKSDLYLFEKFQEDVSTSIDHVFSKIAYDELEGYEIDIIELMEEGYV